MCIPQTVLGIASWHTVRSQQFLELMLTSDWLNFYFEIDLSLNFPIEKTFCSMVTKIRIYFSILIFFHFVLCFISVCLSFL